MVEALQGVEWKVNTAAAGQSLPEQENGMLMGIHTRIVVRRGDEDCCTKKCFISDPCFPCLQSEATQFAQFEYLACKVVGFEMQLSRGSDRVSICSGGLPKWKPMSHPIAICKMPGADGALYLDRIGTVITKWEPDNGTVEFTTGLGTSVRLSNMNAQIQHAMMGPGSRLGNFKAAHPNAQVHTNCSSNQSHHEVRVKPSVFGGKTTVSADSDSGTSAGDPGVATSQIAIGPSGAIPVVNAQVVEAVPVADGSRLLPQSIARS